MTQLLAMQYKLLGNNFAVIADLSKTYPIILASNFCSVDELIDTSSIKDVKSGKWPELKTALNGYENREFELISKFKWTQTGPEFSRRIWQEISKIKPGRTKTYLEIATNAGNPKATRAAGSACGKNSVPIFVPCHRVVPSAGGVGNYAGGADLKAQLLHHENGMRQVQKSTSQK